MSVRSVSQSVSHKEERRLSSGAIAKVRSAGPRASPAAHSPDGRRQGIERGVLSDRTPPNSHTGIWDFCCSGRDPPGSQAARATLEMHSIICLLLLPTDRHSPKLYL